MQSSEIVERLMELAKNTNYPKEDRDLFEDAAANISSGAAAAEILREHEGNVLEGKSWPEQVEYMVNALRDVARNGTT